MDWRKVAFIIAFLNAFGLCQAFFEGCDSTLNITSTGTLKIDSPGFPQYGYYWGTSCRYTIVAPTEFQVQATCSINLYNNPSNGVCTDEKFYLATDGKKDSIPSKSTPLCGYKTVTVTSQGNQLVLAYISTSKPGGTFTGTFNCTITTKCDCGWSISSRIVGGTEAGVNEFTPMAGLVAATTNFVFCGATIVSPFYCLTAAHCAKISPANQTVVLVGDHNTTTGTDTIYAAVYRIDSYIVHPNYTIATNQNDICLIKTILAIKYSRAVGPACLPFFYTSTDFTGQNITATGWGTTEYGGARSEILLKVVITILSNSDAKSKAAYPNMTSSQMCAYGVNKDTCQLDSGGPLWYFRGSNPRLYIVGAVSAGSGCGTDAPSLNTRVSSFMPWIENVIGTGTLCRRAFEP